MKLVPRAVRLMRPSLFEFIKSKEDFDFLVKPLMQMLDEKRISIYVHKVYDVRNAAEAHSALEGRDTQGKLLLKI